MKWLLRGAAALAALLVIAFLVFRTPDTDAAEMRAKYGGAPSQFVALGNALSVHLRDEGPREALPIVLLHGSNADLHTWQPWVDGLKADFRVIRFDQRGHGLTGPAPDGDYSTERFVGDIEALADRLGLARFVIGGNSMGGGHAMAFAVAHPERVAGIVLVDAGGAPARRERGSGNLGFRIAATPGINRIVAQVTPRSLIESSLRQSVSNQSVVTPQVVDRYWELLRYPGNRAATLARFAGGWQTIEEAEVASVTAPALILWGEEDALIPLSVGQWYDRLLPDSTLVVYPGIGHLPHEEAAADSLRDLRAWLASEALATSGSE